MASGEAVFVYTGSEEVPATAVHVRVRSVESIPDGAFRNRRFLASVQLHQGLRKIGWGAFCGCVSLEGIQVPSTVTAILDRAFSRCVRLTSVDLSEGLRSIGRTAFAQCHSLEHIRIPSSVASIGNQAFSHCVNLRSANLPEGIREIRANTFRSCESLEDVRLPCSIAAIGDSAFNGCASLRSVHLPEGLQTIGVWSFLRCRSLESVRLPPSVTEIGGRAFGDCDSLASVQLAGGRELKTVGLGAFEGCPSSESFRFSSLSNRMDALVLDRGAEIEVEARIAEISVLARRGGESWTAGRESLGRVHGLVAYWELREATTILEMALWKAKLDAERDEGEQNEGTLYQEWQEEGLAEEEGKEGNKEDVKVIPCLSREECRVKCGADIIVKEVLHYLH